MIEIDLEKALETYWEYVSQTIQSFWEILGPDGIALGLIIFLIVGAAVIVVIRGIKK